MDLLRELLTEFINKGQDTKVRTKEFTDITKWQSACRDMGYTTHQADLDMVAVDKKGRKLGKWSKAENKGTLNTISESTEAE